MQQLPIFLAFAFALAVASHPERGGHVLQRLGSVDLGILAETTPLVWHGELWLLECIQGGRYYDNINYTSYPNKPQPSGYLRFVNVKTGAHSPSFAAGYGLASGMVLGPRLFVSATATPFGISDNNTVVSIFWSDDMTTWSSKAALDVSQPGMFPKGVTSKKIYNTCVQPVTSGRAAAGATTFVMAYEFNEPAAGWQTGIAVTTDADLTKATWTVVPRPSNAAAVNFGRLAHANPTLRYGEVDGDGGYWYLLSTRNVKSVQAMEVWRTRDVMSFDWEPPPGWREDNVLAAAFIAPSHQDQVPVRAPWHPDTRPIVAGNASAVFNATNDNVSDLDLCTVRQENGEDTTVLYYAWGNQGLGPTAMVLSVAIVGNCSQERLLASRFV